MSSSLPSSFEDFLEHNLTNIDASNPTIPDSCYICHEELDATHQASQITGIPDCSHIFGRDCLVTWVSSNNANRNSCPMCRTTLYVQPLSRQDEVNRLDAALDTMPARWNTLEGRTPQQLHDAQRQGEEILQQHQEEFMQSTEEVLRMSEEVLRDIGELRRRLEGVTGRQVDERPQPHLQNDGEPE
ncbi:hypothetical protein BU16DRAFT_26271 [Lophium mytilinum]|uniref:RING-type domain-containing protein n=1 Tax=Lophium mytilinum TaxID=390894 RepID=A0A6A6RGW1_9PEZI|nr:hypothetical protein BU16DRAFT_26271 [Lophium mytilinum]